MEATQHNRRGHVEMTKPIDVTQIDIELPDRTMRILVSSTGVVKVKERASEGQSFGDVGSGYDVRNIRLHPSSCFDDMAKLECVCGLEPPAAERPDWHPSFPLRAVR